MTTDYDRAVEEAADVAGEMGREDVALEILKQLHSRHAARWGCKPFSPGMMQPERCADIAMGIVIGLIKKDVRQEDCEHILRLALHLVEEKTLMARRAEGRRLIQGG